MRHAAAWQLARESLETGTSVALITVAAVKGSAPREAGACMCVTAESCSGTIGGGTLEFKAIASARELLLGEGTWLHQQLGLGPALGQCCGGRVELILEQLDTDDLEWLEKCDNETSGCHLLSHYDTTYRRKSIVASHATHTQLRELDNQQLQLSQPLHPGYFHLLLFGAGHLGKALAPILATLPCTVHWVDAREDTLPDSAAKTIRREWLEAPTIALQDAPAGSMALVMTHNHALDFEITAAALANENITWVGMIGSNSKRLQFERHLRKQIPSISSDRLSCPIGESSSNLRDPAELAITLAAALLQARHLSQASASETQYHA